MEKGRAGSSDERAARTAARVAEAQDTLLREVGALQSGDDWRAFLDFQSRLHAYSAGNAMLIFSQHSAAHENGQVTAPTPTYVAGFHTWRSIGRWVEKGQHGYAILAPCRYERRQAVDADGRTRRLGKDESPAAGESTREGSVLGGFRVEHVFDVSQTSGAPVPEPPQPQLLEGESPEGLGAYVLELVEARGYRVEGVATAGDIGGANGQTNWQSKTVVVRTDMDDAAMVKTLIHEAAHVVLHAEPPGLQLVRALKEVEAESVAFVVARAHGMSTAEYSFPYVASWAGRDGTKAVLATQQRVATAARLLIEASPAPHLTGGRVPGAREAVMAARSSASSVVASSTPVAQLGVAAGVTL